MTLRAGLLAVLALLTISAPSVHRARASVVLALDLAELVAEADHVLVVTAVAEHARWSRNGKQIVTDVELRNEQTLKGPARPGQVLVATRLGGTLGELALQVPGEARLGAGQRALVFLEASDGELRFVGMSQGVLALRGSGNDTMALPGGSGMALVERDGNGALVPGSSALAEPRRLSELSAEIRKLASPR